MMGENSTVGAQMLENGDPAGPDELISYSEYELRSLIFDRLHGRDTRLWAENDAAGLLHIPIARIFSIAPYSLRARLRSVVGGLLREIASEGMENWPDAALAELLLLCDPVLLDSDRRDEICEDVRRIGDENPTVRYEAYQALITLRYRADRDFWTQLYNSREERYVPVVLGGLSLLDVSSPIQWATEIEWTERVETCFLGILPGLMEEYSAGSVARSLGEAMPRFSARAMRAIRCFCAEENLTLPEDGNMNAAATDITDYGPVPPWYFRNYGLTSSLFLCALLLSELTSFRVFAQPSFNWYWTAAGTFLIWLTYAISTVMTEVYGFQRSRRAIWKVLALTGISCLFPGAVFGFQRPALLLMTTSLTAVAFGEFANAIALIAAKRKEKQKYNAGLMAYRFIVAGAIGHALDSSIFFLLWDPNGHGVSLALGGFLAKIVLQAVAVIPMTRITIRLQKQEGVSVGDTYTNLTPFSLRIREEKYAEVPVSGGASTAELVLQSIKHPLPRQ